jgi:uncharacterized membrane protein
MSQTFGAGYYPPPRPSPQPVNHPKAVPALVLGILSLVLCGLFTGIPAIVMGRRAANDIRYYPSRYTGLGIASGGFWTGLIGTILSCISIVAFVALIVIGVSTGTDSQTTCRTVSPHHPHRSHAC